MKDADCVALLQWALPRLGLRWAGFRKVRRRLCKRIARRLRALGLADARAYRERLETDPAERRELPADWRDRAFERRRRLWCLREEFRERVELAQQDLLAELPGREFDLARCRNLAFTYFEAEGARRALERIASRLRPGGALVIGLHESLPAPAAGFEPWRGCRAVYRRTA